MKPNRIAQLRDVGIDVNAVAPIGSVQSHARIVDEGRRKYVLQTQGHVLPFTRCFGGFQVVVIGSDHRRVVIGVASGEASRR